MFCVLNIEKRTDNLREKLFGSFIRDEYNAKMVPVFKGAPFYVFNVKVGKRGVDWDKIVYTAGKCTRRLVLTDNTELPKRNDMSEFKSNMLYRKIMENTFALILKNCETKKSVVLIDCDGGSADLLYKIAPFASTLTVITENKKNYEYVCDDIQEKTGLCIVVQSSLAEAEVKIDTNRSVMTVSSEKSCINITSGCDFTVPEIYEKLLPENTDKYTFFSALYELCGVFALGECIFETITVNSEKISLCNLDIKGII